MLHLYLYPVAFDLIRKKCTIDISKLSSENLADECEKILQHHTECVLFLGYLDVGWMLDPKHEARIRRAIRKFETHLVSFHLESIPHSWKNEIEMLHVQEDKNGDTKTIDNGSAVHNQP
jgi:hypothetical protein